MAELHTNLYFKHPDTKIHARLATIFQTINDIPKPDLDKIEDKLLNESLSISPDKGKELFNRLLNSIKESFGEPLPDLIAESRGEIAGYHLLYFVHGIRGDDIIGAILQFIGELSPGVDIRACLTGDDDPWEIFFRYENGKVVSNHYAPDYDEVRADELPDVYRWWHEGLPSEIKDGFINDWLKEEDIEE